MDLLRSHKLSQLPSTHHGVVSLNGTDTLNHAFQTLVRNNILGAPVRVDGPNGSHAYKVIDIVDLVHFVVNLYSEDERLFEHDLHEIMARSGQSNAGKAFTVQNVCDLSHCNPCVPVAETADLSKIADALATGVHRVLVIDHEGTLKNVITQSAIVEFLWKHRSHFTDILEKSLFELNLGAKDVVSAKTSDLAIDAFRSIITRKVTAVGVVNHDGVLIDNISTRDLRHVIQTATASKDTVKHLYSPVAEFLAAKHKEDVAPATAIACKSTDTFAQLLEKIHNNKIHRVYVVNEHYHPIGVVSLKDILDLFARLDADRQRVKAESVLHATTSHGPNV